MAAYIPQPLRDRVRRRARQQCEYCHSIEWLTGQRFEFDHILPLQSGGATNAENLCLACASCNSHKQARVEGLDPESGENFPPFQSPSPALVRTFCVERRCQLHSWHHAKWQSNRWGATDESPYRRHGPLVLDQHRPTPAPGRQMM